MSKLKYFNEKLGSDGFIFVGYSSCWNWHTSGFGAKNSNIVRDCTEIFNKNPDFKKLLIVCGAIGRSGHSKTALLIYAKKGDWVFNDGSFFNKTLERNKHETN